jgi:hypothetical protein
MTRALLDAQDEKERLVDVTELVERQVSDRLAERPRAPA